MKLFGKDKRVKWGQTPLLLFLILILNGQTVSAETIAPGVEYDKYIFETQQIAHVLNIDPKKVILKSVHANDKAHGLETVSSLAKEQHAIAAINGSFFRMGEKVDGLPAGILKIDGRWFGIAYGSRGAMGWSFQNINDGKQDKINAEPSDKNANDKDPGLKETNNVTNNVKVLMDRVQTKTSLEINNNKFPVHGVNQPGTNTKAILYTDAYGKKADSIENGTDIVIQNNIIQAIVPAGDTVIPRGGFVYSLGPEAKRPNLPLFVGAKTKVQIKVNPVIKKHETADWQEIDNIVGGIPLLIENGRILQDYGQERIKAAFTHHQHARTAVGILPSGNWVFVVIEKSQATGSPGMTLPELSSFLFQLGCQMALNLDGGGSSTLYLNGKVVNNPENELDEKIVLPISRPIGDAILVLPREKGV